MPGVNLSKRLCAEGMKQASKDVHLSKRDGVLRG